MNKLVQAVDGYKTYIFITLGILTVFAHMASYIDQSTMVTLLGLFGFGGIAGLRDAISKIENHVLPVEVTTEPAPVPQTITQDGHTYVLQDAPHEQTQVQNPQNPV